MRERMIYFMGNMQTSFEQRILTGVGQYARAQVPRWRLQWGAFSTDVFSQVDGLVVFALDPITLAAVRKSGLPYVVTSTRHVRQGAPSVVTDDTAIGEMAARHFLDKYYRSFAYVGPDIIPFGPARKRAFVRALHPQKVRVMLPEESGDSESRVRKLRARLCELPKATAIFAANDVFARQVLIALEGSKRKVPGDLAVLGVDADELVGLSCPVDLSSIDSAPERIGFQAAELLGRMLADPKRVPADTVVRVPPIGVVEGSSTDALATTDERILRAGNLLRQHACDRAYSIDQLARDCGCSRRTLEQSFAGVTGQGINAHIWKLRMDRARELLRGGSLPLGEVAEQSGFASPYHFSQKFKRDTGKTPGDFRQAR